jgi:lysophospholipase L1-like esterase
MKHIARVAVLVLTTAIAAAPAFAQSPQQLAVDATRYMAMGDSLAAGYKAQPVTQGYAFLLYQNGVFDRMPSTLFNDIAAVGATSADVLAYQVPQALIPAARGGFQPEYITLSVGGNDIALLRQAAASAPPLVLQALVQETLLAYTQNLAAILGQLAVNLPGVKIFVANQYTVPEIEAQIPGGAQFIAAINAATAGVVAGFPHTAYLVDVYEAFLGRTGLLLIERHGASAFEVHLTNAGHRVMADAFADVVASYH